MSVSSEKKTKKRGPGRPKGSKNKKTTQSSAGSGSEKSSMTAAEKKREEIRLMQENRRSEKNVYDVIWGIIFIAIGAFVFAAVQFEAAGAFGNKMGEILRGIFGLVGVILPWYFIIIGIMLITHAALHFSKRSLIVSFIMLISLCLINSGRFIGDGSLSYDLGSFYSKGVSLDGGGVLGMTAGTFIVKTLGRSGLYIISITALLVCLLLFIKTPLSIWMEKAHDKSEEKKLMREAERAAAEQQRKAEAQAAQGQALPVSESSRAKQDIKVQTPAIQSAPSKTETSSSGGSSDYSRFFSGGDKSTPVTPAAENSNAAAGTNAASKNASSSSLYYDGEGSSAKPGKNHSNIPSLFKKHIFGHEDEDNKEKTFGLEEKKQPEAGHGLDSSVPEPEGYGLTGGAKPEIKIDRFGIDEAPEAGSEPSNNDEGTQVKAAAVNAYAGGDGVKDASKKVNVSDAELAETANELNSGMNKPAVPKYKKPSLDLLDPPKKIDQTGVDEKLKRKAQQLERTLSSFNVDAHVVQVTQGPAVTRYEIQPGPGVKVSKIVALSDDIALNLKAKSIRMEAPIPGKAAVGVEVENDKINMVTLREVLSSREFRNASSKISFAVGKDIAGNTIVGDLEKMPHLLIAGATGSGKSVCINSIIMSILYKADPDEVKLMLIDPKVVELGIYNGIPHQLIPVVTDPAKAAAALNWAVVHMTERYKKFAEANARNIDSYNKKMKAEGRDDEVMPKIVIIIDELADLMMAAPKQVEQSICRLAQLARAAGMHLIVATQRPSVDIITGVIKANIPSRIAFAVSSQVDSRTILDKGGAEHLVGKGDMLYSPVGMGKPLRVQGTFVSDREVADIIDFVKSQAPETNYSEDVIEKIDNGVVLQDDDDDADELLHDAEECVIDAGQASVSMLQRRFRIGYNRAARIMDEMEARGIVGPQDGSRPRKILVSKADIEPQSAEDAASDGSAALDQDVDQDAAGQE